MVIFGRTRVCSRRKRKSSTCGCGREIDPADDADAFGLGLDPVKNDAFANLIEFDAVEPFHEIELVPGAAKFTVGRELQPDLFLFFDRPFDLAVFNRTQRIGRDLVSRSLPPGLFQRRRPQQAADLIWRGLGAAVRCMHVLLEGRAPPLFLVMVVELLAGRVRFSKVRQRV